MGGSIALEEAGDGCLSGSRADEEEWTEAEKSLRGRIRGKRNQGCLPLLSSAMEGFEERGEAKAATLFCNSPFSSLSPI